IQSELHIYSTGATDATVRLSVDGAQFTVRGISLTPGENVLSFEQTAQAPGFHKIEATVETANDTFPDNNAASATLVVKQQPKVLVLEDRLGEAAQIASALSGQQMTVDVRDPSAIPPQCSELDGYDTVVLSNVAATSFTLG